MREEDAMYYQRVLSSIAIRTEAVKNHDCTRQLQYLSKRRALEITLESDHEGEDWYGNLTNRRNFDNEVVIESDSNYNDKDSNSNCSNTICVRDEGMNDHNEQILFQFQVQNI